MRVNGIRLASSFFDVCSSVSRSFACGESRYKCGSCGWEQQSRFATVCVRGGGSSNTGSASHIHLCRKKKANIKVDTCYTSPVV